MSDNAPADLTSLGMDLATSFRPSWAKDSAQETPAARYADHPGEDRRERGGGGNFPDRRGGRDGRGGANRGPRREGDARGARDQRGDSKGSGDRKGGGPRKGQGKGGGRDDRSQDPAATKPEPQLVGWEARFLPDPRGVEGVARQIRAAAKAYPLFDLARLVLAGPERYLVTLRPTDTAQPLFVFQADQTLWPSESAAIRHAVTTAVEKFYRKEFIEVGAPKGNFPIVAECDGVLLGPPNHHEYTARLQKLHRERFSRMPFEAFKSRVRMLRDEEAIARWKEAESRREVFFPMAPQPADAVPPAPDPGETESAPDGVADGDEAGIPSVLEDTAAAGDVVSPEASALPVEAPGVVAEASENDASEQPAEVGQPATVDAGAGEALKDIEALTAHFRAHHAAREIVRVVGEITVPGIALSGRAAGPVRAFVQAEREKLDRFPLPLSNIIGHELARRGLQVFKAHQNITYVGIARPRPLPRSQLGESLRTMVDTLSAHARDPRPELWKALLASRPLPADGSESAREHAVSADLSWLLHEGHVVDFANRGFEIVPERAPKEGQDLPKEPEAPQA